MAEGSPELTKNWEKMVYSLIYYLKLSQLKNFVSSGPVIPILVIMEVLAGHRWQSQKWVVPGAPMKL